MEKIFIENRKQERISLLLHKVENQKGIAFVMHGLGGFKEQPHIQTIGNVLNDNGYSTIIFDTTRSIGESDGKYEDATVTSSLMDLEDVITWASGQAWYQEPFVLIGHSLGGICSAIYAQKFPEKVKTLIPVSTVVSGQFTLDVSPKEEIEEWKRTGWQERSSASKPGVIKRLKWSHMEDRLKYDLLPNADKLTMPVLLIVGENDETTPEKHQRILYEKLPGKKVLEVIQGAPHTFREQEHLDAVYNALNHWLKTIS